MPRVNFQKKIHSLGPSTLLLLTVTVAVFVLQKCLAIDFSHNNQQVEGLFTQVCFSLGSLSTPAILEGEYWRFFTYMFLHASVIHIMFNMYALFHFDSLEKLFPRYTYLAVYIFFGLFSGLVSFAWASFGDTPHPVGTVGASGAIFGLLGFLFGYMMYVQVHDGDAQLRRTISKIVLVAVCNVGIGFVLNVDAGVYMVDNACHLGGLAIGTMGGVALSYYHMETGSVPASYLEKSPTLVWVHDKTNPRTTYHAKFEESNSPSKTLIILTVYRDAALWISCVEFGNVVAKASPALTREEAMNWCVKYTKQELSKLHDSIGSFYLANHIIKESNA